MGHYPIIYFRVVDPGRSSLWRPRQRPTMFEVTIDRSKPEIVDFKGLAQIICQGRGNTDLYAAKSIAMDLYTAGHHESWVNYPSLGTGQPELPDQ